MYVQSSFLLSQAALNLPPYIYLLERLLVARETMSVNLLFLGKVYIEFVVVLNLFFKMLHYFIKTGYFHLTKCVYC